MKLTGSPVPSFSTFPSAWARKVPSLTNSAPSPSRIPLSSRIGGGLAGGVGEGIAVEREIAAGRV